MPDDKALKDWRQRIESKIDKLFVLLTGDGNPQRGIIVRLDRVEQQAGRVAIIQRVVVTTVIAAIVAATMAWLLR